MAATARVIWLCTYVWYWPFCGDVVVCVSNFIIASFRAHTDKLSQNAGVRWGGGWGGGAKPTRQEGPCC